MTGPGHPQTIEIISDVALIALGDVVDASEATHLNLLNISPFSYGLAVENVFDDASVFRPKVLDITDDNLKTRGQPPAASN